MTHTWTNLESAPLPGNRSLRQCLGGDERGAFFRTTWDDEGTSALVRLVPAELVDPETQLALWRRTRHLYHPNLVALLECGRAMIAGDEYLYALFEYPDDRLDPAMEQPLPESEVRGILEAVVKALRYLHAQG